MSVNDLSEADLIFYRRAGISRSVFLEQARGLDPDLEENSRKAKLEKLTAQAIHVTLRESFYESYLKHPGEYISFKAISIVFPKVKEAVLRSHLTKLRRTFLMENNLLLANAPLKGYRLGISEDISDETTKAVFRGWGDLCSAIFISARTTEHHHDLTGAGQELLTYSRQAAQQALEPLKRMEARLALNPSMKRVLRQTSELRKYIEELSQKENPSDLLDI